MQSLFLATDSVAPDSDDDWDSTAANLRRGRCPAACPGALAANLFIATFLAAGVGLKYFLMPLMVPGAPNGVSQPNEPLMKCVEGSCMSLGLDITDMVSNITAMVGLVSWQSGQSGESRSDCARRCKRENSSGIAMWAAGCECIAGGLCNVMVDNGANWDPSSGLTCTFLVDRTVGSWQYKYCWDGPGKLTTKYTVGAKEQKSFALQAGFATAAATEAAFPSLTLQANMKELFSMTTTRESKITLDPEPGRTQCLWQWSYDVYGVKGMGSMHFGSNDHKITSSRKMPRCEPGEFKEADPTGQECNVGHVLD